jgi:HEAT repeat protein
MKAAEQLQHIGPAARAAVPALIVNLGSGHDGGRQLLNVAATNALLRIGPGAALPALIEAVKGQDRDVAYGAAFTIGGFGKAAKPAIPTLLAALDDPAVRPAANTALQMIDEES